jgi:hypothetical protein
MDAPVTTERTARAAKKVVVEKMGPLPLGLLDRPFS